MNTSEILMTDPTTEAGRKYWEDRRRLEEWQAAQADETPDKGPAACSNCGETDPDSALDSDGLCHSCCFKRHIEARRRREEYERIVDGQYEISDVDPGL